MTTPAASPRVAAIMNASTVLAREVLAVIEERPVDPFSELRLFGTTEDTYLRFGGKDIRIHTKGEGRFAGVQVAILGGPAERHEGAIVIAPVPDVAPPSRAGRPEVMSVFDLLVVDPALEEGLPEHAGTVYAPRTAVSIIARVARALRARRVTATILEPAGELGPSALTELYDQTMALFAHKALPDAVFGDRLAYNVLPGRGLLHGLERLAGCPVAATSLLLPLFAGTLVSLDVETAPGLLDVEDLLEDASIEVHEDVQPATVVGADAVRVRILSNESGRVRLLAAADEARLTATSLVELASRALTTPSAAE
jgi:hypothetical protein